MSKRRPSTFERLNRRERRQWERRLYSPNPGLVIVNPNAAGIDVGNESHFVAVPPDRDENPVREFGSWTESLHRTCEWLLGCGIDTVVMQATGVYWMALYDLLESRGLRVVLCNAQHTKNLPGRKSDVQECQWLMKLHTYGLLPNSFRRPEAMRGIRTVWGLRGRHVEEACKAVQHMQKALTKMNLQLANVISDISGVTGLAIIKAILQGERDIYALADLRDRRVQASREEVARSLEGTWRDDLLFELQQGLDAYEFAQQQMQRCDVQLQKYMEQLPSRPALEPKPAEAPADGKSTRKGRRKDPPAPRGNAPAWDVTSELKRVTGVDLTRIDGIKAMTAFTIVAELGTDLSAFPDEDHFSSWLGLTPNKRVTGGKVVGHDKRNVRNRVAAALRMAASTLKESKSWLGAFYRHKCRALPAHASANKATAHYLAKLVYRMMTKGEDWVDRGAEQFQRRRDDLDLEALSKRAQAKGYALTPMAQA